MLDASGVQLEKALLAQPFALHLNLEEAKFVCGQLKLSQYFTPVVKLCMVNSINYRKRWSLSVL